MHKSTLFYLLFPFIIFTFQAAAIQPPAPFDFNRSLRIDFVFTGDKSHQVATISQYLEGPVYGGSANQLIPPFDYGNYRLLLLDAQTADTLFIKGFCTLFEEWQTTQEASNVSRAFKQSVESPLPLIPATVVVEWRNPEGTFSSLIQESFDPETTPVQRIVPANHSYRHIHGKDDPARQADLLFIAEGYRAEEAELFFEDVTNLTDYLFSMAPYSELKEHITVRALAVPSEQSGTDIPHQDIWKNTPLNSSFNTFGVDRYLESYDTWAIYDAAAALPHDHIIALVNSDIYGGGGIYNHFSIATARHRTSPQVLIHEMGHGLAGLADEYYSGEVAYSDFFDLHTEPWQPNITTLVDFNRKWKQLLPDSIPIPTPPTTPYLNTTGVFEGGGYVAKGIYRPAIDCRMKTNEALGFCEVCRASIRKVILFFNQ